MTELTAGSLTGSTIQAFVQDIIAQAEAGLNQKGFTTCSEREHHVKIELNATEVQEAGGGFKAHIFSIGAGAEAKASDSQTQKVTIFAKKLNDVDEAERKAKIARAKAQEQMAKEMPFHSAVQK